MKSVALVVPAVAVVAAALTSCSAGADAAKPGQVSVAASFYPLAWVSEQIAPDAAVTDLTRPGLEPHDVELTFAQTVDLARADLVVYERGFQPAVDQGVDNDAEGATLDVGPVAGLQDFASDPGQVDPHFWQDPLKLLAPSAGAVAARARPDRPGRTPRRTTPGRPPCSAGWRRSTTTYRTGLADCARDTVVTSHEAFGYLSRYGIRVAPITGLAPGAEPTPSDLARLQRADP